MHLLGLKLIKKIIIEIFQLDARVSVTLVDKQGFFEMYVAFNLSLSFAACSAVRITRFNVSSTHILENQEHPSELVLDCDYDIDPHERGFVLKWLLNNSQIYQWIPGQHPSYGFVSTMQMKTTTTTKPHTHDSPSKPNLLFLVIADEERHQWESQFIRRQYEALPRTRHSPASEEHERQLYMQRQHIHFKRHQSETLANDRAAFRIYIHNQIQ